MECGSRPDVTTSQELAQQCHQEVTKLPESWQIAWLRLTGQPFHRADFLLDEAGVSWGNYRILASANGTYLPFIAGVVRFDRIGRAHLLPAVMELIKMFAHNHQLQLD